MMAESISSSSSSCPPRPEHYDVFLSFRGEDTRRNFTSHLHAALCRKNIATFIDDKQIERGDELSSTLLNAIERSKISIIIFSENYAFSKWCLNELVRIMKCKNTKQHTVIPVFYHIDPTHVRKQSGPFKDAFAKYENEIDNQSKIETWRMALQEAAESAGWDSSNIWLESELVEKIVEDVLQKLNQSITPKVSCWLVGIENHIAQLQPLLCFGSTDVRIIGIWGMGGIGKTTIADALFNIFSSDFQGCCFVGNVREEWKNNRQKKLRNKLLSEILGDQKLHIKTPSVSSSFVVDRLQSRKLLIVLDDVSNHGQIEYLVGEKNWFGPGSRIIVTTRNKDVLRMDDKLYEVKPLNNEEGLQLFSSKAFHQDQPNIDFIQISKKVVNYAGGIPLVLKVLGSLLHSKRRGEWNSTLKKLKKVPHEEIHHVLSLSYKGLDFAEQTIFLDIACFFEGERKSHIVNIFDGCGFSTNIILRSLQDKSLLTISKHNRVEMHDVIQEMGWKIVREESSNEPEKQSRLWDPEDIYCVLKCQKGSDSSIESILLDMSQIRDVQIRPQTFAKMNKLRLLKFGVGCINKECNVHISKDGIEALPDALRYLCWDHFPLKILPPSFCGEMLVELDLRNSLIVKLWDAEPDLPNLKSLRLTCSKHLIELPNLSKAKSLEEIFLDFCSSLQKVPSSIFSLPRLLAVSLVGCEKLEYIRSDMHSRSLRWLDLSWCSSLAEFSVTSKKLEYLNLNDTAINHVPRSVRGAKNLSCLSLAWCGRLETLPKNFYQMGSDTSLNIDHCLKLEKLPPIIDTSLSIAKLYLDGCSNLLELPENLGHLLALDLLSVEGSCIETLPASIKLLSKLRTLNVRNCSRLQSLPELPVLLKDLNASGCMSLETMSSTAAAALIKDSFGSQKKILLFRQIQERKISIRHQDYSERFDFCNCTRLDENTHSAIVAEAIMRIKYAVYLLSILQPSAEGDDPCHQFHLISKDFGHENFEYTCRRLCTTAPEVDVPAWFKVREAESSALTIKLNANCCSECKASPFAFGLFESNNEENNDFGFDGRHRVCIRQESSFPKWSYYKLWVNDVKFSFPGNRVPSCFRCTTETTLITVELPPI